MNRTELLAFLRAHRLCVQSSPSASGAPQAAVVGYGVSDDLEIVFDTVGTTRKMQNLRRDARVALVIGWDDQTVQLEGCADEPQGDDLARLKEVYFGVYPDGVERQSWQDITYVRVRPTWARYSDFRPGGSVALVAASELGAPATRVGSEGMLDHLSVGATDLARSGAFYDAALAPLGYVRLFGNERGVGYGVPGAKDEAFAILARGDAGTLHGDGCHVAFRARTRQAVDAFHMAALRAGAVDEGAPGPRPAYGPTYYAAFVRDLDGHRLEAVCHEA